jgi:UDP-N-acetylmuramoyl-tripeptide--D-alanyl-D-alanine ligase
MQLLYDKFLESNGVCTDTRALKPGQIFFALKGPNFNGNKYAKQALENGAIAAVIDEVEYHEIPAQMFLVEDGLRALQNLATYHRRQLGTELIGLTGSNGKTTSKELIHAVLSKKYKTHATRGNFNNHIGVPLTLLQLKPEHELGIIEMGANHQKEIELLASIAEPDSGLITNIGKAHLEGFGGLAGVKKGKGELFDFLREKENGLVFVWTGQQDLIDLSAGIKNQITYGAEEEADIVVRQKDEDLFLSIEAQIPGSGTIEIRSQLVGAYNLSNLAAAIAIGNHYKVEPGLIKEGLEEYVPEMNRSELKEIGGNTWILDAYNANPSSMEVAVKHFARTSPKPRGLILGDMLELGDESLENHQLIVDVCKESRFDFVVLVGPEFAKTTHSFLHFENSEQAASWFSEKQLKGHHILIKGSRGIALEKILPSS